MAKCKIIYNIEKSTYLSYYGRFTFYFSSSINRDKFESRVYEYVNNENDKLNVKLGFPIDLKILFVFSLYIKIEKRGFYVYNDFIQKFSRSMEEISLDNLL